MKKYIIATLVLGTAALTAQAQVVTTDLELHYTPASLVPSATVPNLSQWTSNGDTALTLTNNLGSPTITDNNLNGLDTTNWDNDRMRTGASTNLNGNNVTGMTMMGLFRINDAPSATNIFLTPTYSGTAGSRPPVSMFITSTNTIGIYSGNAAGSYIAGPTQAYTPDAWQTWAATWSTSGDLKLYLNGSQVGGTVTGANLGLAGNAFSYFEVNSSNATLNMDIAEMMLYSSTLSDAQVLQNSNYLASTYAIPEPSSAALTLAGMVGLIALSRRRRRA